VFLALALLGPLIVRGDPTRVDLLHALSGPSLGHPLGTDHLGRDQLARLVTAARTTLAAVAIVLTGAVIIGTLIGLVAGFVGGLIDQLLMRLTDAVLSLPSLITALAILGALGPGFRNMLLGLVVSWWPIYARYARAQVLAVRRSTHVEALRVLGVPAPRILRRHVLPAVVGPAIVLASADAGVVILVVATLSFLGVGVQPPTPEWGQMIVDAQPYLQTQPMLVILPGLAITATVVVFNVLGEALVDDRRVRRFRAALAARLLGVRGTRTATPADVVTPRAGT
jgi:peptide/nickel transport system permease protein